MITDQRRSADCFESALIGLHRRPALGKTFSAALRHTASLLSRSFAKQVVGQVVLPARRLAIGAVDLQEPQRIANPLQAASLPYDAVGITGTAH